MAHRFLTCASFLILACVTVVAVRVRRHIPRNRAEMLLADMQSINLRQTTFQDLQPMFRRWRRWGKYDGPCNQSRCTFYISLIDLDTPLNRFLYVHNRLFDLAAVLGERPTAIHARLTVLDGRVWSEGIAFGIETRGQYSDGKTYTEIVGGAATSVSRINTHFGGRSGDFIRITDIPSNPE